MMNIRAVDMVGAMNDAPVVPVAAPARAMETSQTSQTSGRNGDISAAQVKEMVADMQGQLDSMNISLRYTFYGENGKNIAIKVVNKDTGEVIREIPAKEMQALQAKMSELVGMIFNASG